MLRGGCLTSPNPSASGSTRLQGMAEADAEPVFEADTAPPPNDEAALVVDLDVYEGPIDVLLTLARDQKVDLKQISILKLADQYIAFIERARAQAERFRLEIAAD